MLLLFKKEQLGNLNKNQKLLVIFDSTEYLKYNIKCRLTNQCFWENVLWSFLASHMSFMLTD